jgi:hypothetical protein
MSAPEEKVYLSAVDRAGQVMTADHGGTFIQVETPGLTPNHPVRWKGLVIRIVADAKGPIVYAREWRAGRLLQGRDMAARPEHCLVIQAPKGLRERQAERAREVLHDRRLKEEIAHRKRMRALGKGDA